MLSKGLDKIGVKKSNGFWINLRFEIEIKNLPILVQFKGDLFTNREYPLSINLISVRLNNPLMFAQYNVGFEL